MKKTTWAWAAGLFDGEGCVHFQKSTNNRPVLKLAMTHRKTVERFGAVVGVAFKLYMHSQATARRSQRHWKPVYAWYITRIADVKIVLKGLLPYLVTKRREAKRALAALMRRTGPRRKGYKPRGG